MAIKFNGTIIGRPPVDRETAHDGTRRSDINLPHVGTSEILNIFTGRVFEVLAIVLLHVRHCELIDVCGDIEVSPTILAQSI